MLVVVVVMLVVVVLVVVVGVSKRNSIVFGNLVKNDVSTRFQGTLLLFLRGEK